MSNYLSDKHQLKSLQSELDFYEKLQKGGIPTPQVPKKLTKEVIDRTLEGMNFIYLCSTMIKHAWMINSDVKLGNPNLNNFNKRIGQDALSILKALNCKPKDIDMAEERAVELYRAINNLSQYNTEDLERFNDLTENELLNQTV